MSPARLKGTCLLLKTFHAPGAKDNPLEACINHWVDAVAKGEHHAGQQNYLEIRYEDLITESEKELKFYSSFSNLSGTRMP